MAQHKIKPVTLETLARGAAVERFNDALDVVLNNILDPNTDATALRAITLVVKIKPNDRREAAGCAIGVSTKLAAPKVVPTQFYLGRVEGAAVACENDPRQLGFDDLDDEEEGDGEQRPASSSAPKPTAIDGGKGRG